MVDYIIVGVGLGGIAFCETLEEQQKSFVVFDDDSQQSSNVAGGMYNPVTLKRFTAVWKSQEQLELLTPYYKKLEDKLSIKIDHKLQVLRKFASIEEQNTWFEASDKPNLQPFLSTSLLKNTNQKINAPLGFGEVLHTGRVDVNKLQLHYISYLKSQAKFFAERIDYQQLQIEDDCVMYKNITAKKIVFCEGFGLQYNPFFNYLPLTGTKGELLDIEIEDFDLDFILKSGAFIIPLGGNKYKVGATNNWADKTNEITTEARHELEEKLQGFLKSDYKVTNQLVGIRPTVIDRKPLLGNHPNHKNIFILNGLGSRGVMISPYVAQKLFDYIENEISLEKEIDIKRFENKYFKAM
ncbi:NAD(P)/FAD-dependent oxidoreductase [Joostella sp. CR20]|uniref:NAD(P)/FAD-dependent oxidoreductase n=1 Tax=Joostella sp. CR20 TaxID=2804312 RepID=UPI00313C5319